MIVGPEELEVGSTVRFQGFRLVNGAWTIGEVCGEIESFERRGQNRWRIVVVGPLGDSTFAEVNSDARIEVTHDDERRR